MVRQEKLSHKTVQLPPSLIFVQWVWPIASAGWNEVPFFSRFNLSRFMSKVLYQFATPLLAKLSFAVIFFFCYCSFPIRKVFALASKLLNTLDSLSCLLWIGFFHSFWILVNLWSLNLPYYKWNFPLWLRVETVCDRHRVKDWMNSVDQIPSKDDFLSCAYVNGSMLTIFQKNCQMPKMSQFSSPWNTFAPVYSAERILLPVISSCGSVYAPVSPKSRYLWLADIRSRPLKYFWFLWPREKSRAQLGSFTTPPDFSKLRASSLSI